MGSVASSEGRSGVAGTGVARQTLLGMMGAMCRRCVRSFSEKVISPYMIAHMQTGEFTRRLPFYRTLHERVERRPSSTSLIDSTNTGSDFLSCGVNPPVCGEQPLFVSFIARLGNSINSSKPPINNTLFLQVCSTYKTLATPLYLYSTSWPLCIPLLPHLLDLHL